jgi:hypothetical protein
MKITYLIWYDASSFDDWIDISEVKPELAEIHSCGILVSENKEALVIAVNKDNTNDKVSCSMSVPKAWIKFRKNISV